MHMIRLYLSIIVFALLLVTFSPTHANLVPELSQQFVYDDTPEIIAGNKQWRFHFDVQVYDTDKTLLVIPFACIFTGASRCSHSELLTNNGLLNCRSLYDAITAGNFFNDNIQALSEFCDKGDFLYSDLVQLQTVLSQVGNPSSLQHSDGAASDVDNAQSWMSFSASESVVTLHYEASTRTQFSIWSDDTALLETQISLVFVLLDQNHRTDDIWNVRQHFQIYFLQKPASVSASFDVVNDCVNDGFITPLHGFLQRKLINGAYECVASCYHGFIREPFNQLAQRHSHTHQLQECFKPKQEHVATILTASLHSTRRTLANPSTVSTEQLSVLDNVAQRISENLQSEGFGDVHTFCKIPHSGLDDTDYDLSLMHAVGVHKIQDSKLVHEIHQNKDYIFTDDDAWPFLMSCLLIIPSLNAQPYSTSHAAREAFIKQKEVIYAESWEVQEVDVKFVSRLAFTVKYELAKVNVQGQRIALWVLELVALCIAARVFYQHRFKRH